MLKFFRLMKKPLTTTHQQKQLSVVNNKPIFYEPDDQKRARSILTSRVAVYIPAKKVDGPLQCTVKWFFHNTKKQDGEWR